jgi:uncharacterized membrane-anchored protein
MGVHMSNGGSQVEYNIEESKANIEYLKHITSLSTGSILLLAAFLEKIFVNPQGRGLIQWVFVGFTACIFFATLTQFCVIYFFRADGTNKATAILLGLSMLTFIAATILLTVFAVENFNRTPPPTTPTTSASPQPPSMSAQGNSNH